MKDVISIEYPASLANSLRLKGKDFEMEMKTSSLVKLFELGKVSSGTAAKVLGISRLDFLELLAKYNVSPLGQDSTEDLLRNKEVTLYQQKLTPMNIDQFNDEIDQAMLDSEEDRVTSAAELKKKVKAWR